MLISWSDIMSILLIPIDCGMCITWDSMISVIWFPNRKAEVPLSARKEDTNQLQGNFSLDSNLNNKYKSISSSIESTKAL